jgi:ferrous iron transport protein A
MTSAAIRSSQAPSPDVLLLADLAPNRVTTIVGLAAAAQDEDGASGLLQRLAELGFMAGETISVLRRGPGGREPIAVQVGDTVFALRRHEASCVQVRKPA